MSLDDVTVDFTENRTAQLYTTWSAPSTRKAIADAKRVYAKKNGVDKSDVTGRKWEDGWDSENDAPYLTIAVSLASE